MSAWLERFRDQRFSLADAVSFEVMSQDGIEHAFAFDYGFRKAGFETFAACDRTTTKAPPCSVGLWFQSED